jgi:hypothetical protein
MRLEADRLCCQCRILSKAHQMLSSLVQQLCRHFALALPLAHSQHN